MIFSLNKYFHTIVFAIFFVFICPNILSATGNVRAFSKHWNPFFVETGSFKGDGIQMALNAGFSNVYSIELSPKYYRISSKRFRKNPHVKIFFGDSAKLLWKVIENIDQPITFWLDGHYSNRDTAKGETMSPILKELDQIKMHHLKNHTILIDDVRQFGDLPFDYVTMDQIIEKIYEINPEYLITFEDGHVKNDILVASILN